MNVAGYAVLGCAISCSVVGQLLLKRGMARYPAFQVRDLLALTRDVAVVAGFAAYGVSVLLYFRALASLDLAVAYPSVSLGYVLTAILARLLFNETINRTRWLAIVVICVGVALIGFGAA